jgi:hypothetical protein
MSDTTPNTCFNFSANIHAEMNREQAARLIQHLSAAMVNDGPITLEIRMEDRWAMERLSGDRVVGNVNISTHGGTLFGASATVIDNWVSIRDEA